MATQAEPILTGQEAQALIDPAKYVDWDALLDRFDDIRRDTPVVRVVNDVWGHDLPDLTLPVAFGAACAVQGLPVEQGAQLFLHAFVSALVSAAIRAVPLGQTDGQRVITALAPLCHDTVTLALTQTIDDIGSVCFLADIASMRHETLYSRMFQT